MLFGVRVGQEYLRLCRGRNHKLFGEVVILGACRPLPLSSEAQACQVYFVFHMGPINAGCAVKSAVPVKF